MRLCNKTKRLSRVRAVKDLFYGFLIRDRAIMKDAALRLISVRNHSLDEYNTNLKG